MKKALASIATIVLGFSLAACGSDDGPSREESERAYIQTLHGENITGSDTTLLAAGDAVCELLDEGFSAMDIALGASMSNNTIVPGTSNSDVPYIVGAAVGALCPRHIEATLKETGL